MRINNNIPALNTFASLNSTNKSLQKTINALSTGLRINSSADDAAGFAISEKMRSQVSGLNVAMRNAYDGVSLLQTAEGALGETNSMLQRMRELCVQASNASLTSTDRQYIQLEIDELKGQIDKIAKTTQFNKKRILDGSSGAMWSSSDMNLKARINGGLVTVDEFGQKVNHEGNYRIEVTAEPGQPQVQKSNIMDLSYTVFETQEVKGPRHNFIDEEVINIAQLSSTVSGKGWNFENGMLNITSDGSYHIIGNSVSTSNHITVASGVQADMLLDNVNIDLERDDDPYACALDIAGAKVDLFLSGENSLTSGGRSAGIEVPAGAEITINSIDGPASENGTLTAKGAIYASGIGGSDSTFVRGNRPYDTSRVAGKITINGGTIYAYGNAGPGIGSTSLNSDCEDMIITINGGNIYAADSRNGYTNNNPGIGVGWSSIVPAIENKSTITIAGGTVSAQGGYNAAGIGGGGNRGSGTIKIKAGLYPDTVTANAGSFGLGAVVPPVDIGHGADANDTYVDLNADISPSFPTSFVKNEVKHGYKLSEISQFYDASGTSIMSQPQTITITQGNGQSANIILYETDTMQDVADKINTAIADGLGQAKYTDNRTKFCTISDGTQGTSESVYDRKPIYDEDGNLKGYDIFATMLVRSAVPSKAGELYFSGNEDLLNALGLNTIQESSESTLTASVYDAHSGTPIVQNAKASGSEFVSLIPPEIDIEVDAMAGLSANWDENTKKFMMASKDVYTAMLHLKNTGIVFQTGANEGEDFIIQLGDSSSDALNLSSVNAVTREAASRSIGLLDRAINRISAQRAKIGAYENGLEHTMDNLTITANNLFEADSRLRDADMASTMMDFVRLQILNQSGTSMLSQANQLPQSVLSLMQ